MKELFKNLGLTADYSNAGNIRAILHIIEAAQCQTFKVPSLMRSLKLEQIQDAPSTETGVTEVGKRILATASVLSLDTRLSVTDCLRYIAKDSTPDHPLLLDHSTDDQAFLMPPEEATDIVNRLRCLAPNIEIDDIILLQAILHLDPKFKINQTNLIALMALRRSEDGVLSGLRDILVINKVSISSEFLEKLDHDIALYEMIKNIHRFKQDTPDGKLSSIMIAVCLFQQMNNPTYPNHFTAAQKIGLLEFIAFTFTQLTETHSISEETFRHAADHCKMMMGQSKFPYNLDLINKEDTERFIETIPTLATKLYSTIRDKDKHQLLESVHGILYKSSLARKFSQERFCTPPFCVQEMTQLFESTPHFSTVLAFEFIVKFGIEFCQYAANFWGDEEYPITQEELQKILQGFEEIAQHLFSDKWEQYLNLPMTWEKHNILLNNVNTIIENINTTLKKYEQAVLDKNEKIIPCKGLEKRILALREQFKKINDQITKVIHLDHYIKGNKTRNLLEQSAGLSRKISTLDVQSLDIKSCLLLPNLLLGHMTFSASQVRSSAETLSTQLTKQAGLLARDVRDEFSSMVPFPLVLERLTPALSHYQRQAIEAAYHDDRNIRPLGRKHSDQAKIFGFVHQWMELLNQEYQLKYDPKSLEDLLHDREYRIHFLETQLKLFAYFLLKNPASLNFIENPEKMLLLILLRRFQHRQTLLLKKFPTQYQGYHVTPEASINATAALLISKLTDPGLMDPDLFNSVLCLSLDSLELPPKTTSAFFTHLIDASDRIWGEDSPSIFIKLIKMRKAFAADQVDISALSRQVEDFCQALTHLTSTELLSLGHVLIPELINFAASINYLNWRPRSQEEQKEMKAWQARYFDTCQQLLERIIPLSSYQRYRIQLDEEPFLTQDLGAFELMDKINYIRAIACAEEQDAKTLQNILADGTSLPWQNALMINCTLYHREPEEMAAHKNGKKSKKATEEYISPILQLCTDHSKALQTISADNINSVIKTVTHIMLTQEKNTSHYTRAISIIWLLLNDISGNEQLAQNLFEYNRHVEGKVGTTQGSATHILEALNPFISLCHTEKASDIFAELFHMASRQPFAKERIDHLLCNALVEFKHEIPKVIIDIIQKNKALFPQFTAYCELVVYNSNPDDKTDLKLVNRDAIPIQLRNFYDEQVRNYNRYKHEKRDEHILTLTCNLHSLFDNHTGKITLEKLSKNLNKLLDQCSEGEQLTYQARKEATSSATPSDIKEWLAAFKLPPVPEKAKTASASTASAGTQANTFLSGLAHRKVDEDELLTDKELKKRQKKEREKAAEQERIAKEAADKAAKEKAEAARIAEQKRQAAAKKTETPPARESNPPSGVKGKQNQPQIFSRTVATAPTAEARPTPVLAPPSPAWSATKPKITASQPAPKADPFPPLPSPQTNAGSRQQQPAPARPLPPPVANSAITVDKTSSQSTAVKEASVLSTAPVVAAPPQQAVHQPITPPQDRVVTPATTASSSSNPDTKDANAALQKILASLQKGPQQPVTANSVVNAHQTVQAATPADKAQSQSVTTTEPSVLPAAPVVAASPQQAVPQPVAPQKTTHTPAQAGAGPALNNEEDEEEQALKAELAKLEAEQRKNELRAKIAALKKDPNKAPTSNIHPARPFAPLVTAFIPGAVAQPGVPLAPPGSYQDAYPPHTTFAPHGFTGAYPPYPPVISPYYGQGMFPQTMGMVPEYNPNGGYYPPSPQGNIPTHTSFHSYSHPPISATQPRKPLTADAPPFVPSAPVTEQTKTQTTPVASEASAASSTPIPPVSAKKTEQSTAADSTVSSKPNGVKVVPGAKGLAAKQKAEEGARPSQPQATLELASAAPMQTNTKGTKKG